MGRVVVGVDGSNFSRRAFRRAREEARLRSATLEAVYVIPPPHRSLTGDFVGLPYASGVNEPRAAGDERIQVAKQRAYSELTALTREESAGTDGPAPDLTVLTAGHPADALMDHATGADMLVIATRGHGGFTGMVLGSVALQCVQHARCPVLVLTPAAE